jgi:hypothetical protein
MFSSEGVVSEFTIPVHSAEEMETIIQPKRKAGGGKTGTAKKQKVSVPSADTMVPAEHVIKF